MDNHQEIKTLNCLGKAIRSYAKMPNDPTKTSLAKTIKLFNSVVKADPRNAFIVPDPKKYLPKGIKAKHLALAAITGLYKRLGNIKKHNAYLKRINYYERNYEKQFI